ncbi:VOC family protein [Arenimonas sp.]|uniref:VOC family protein n=1 Tax=Arenimonas sp. TaxID=1872635 RepID=UPI0039E37450
MNNAKPLTAGGLYVNLPVQDLPKSIAFYTALGFSFNPQFTDETATCMIVGENMAVMLLTQEKFRQFTPLPISDAKKASEVLLCISLDSRAQVDELVRLAVAHGGKTLRAPDDYGFMYSHSFQDLDGHIWEPMVMDMTAFEKARQGD